MTNTAASLIQAGLQKAVFCFRGMGIVHYSKNTLDQIPLVPTPPKSRKRRPLIKKKWSEERRN